MKKKILKIICIVLLFFLLDKQPISLFCKNIKHYSIGKNIEMLNERNKPLNSQRKIIFTQKSKIPSKLKIIKIKKEESITSKLPIFKVLNEEYFISFYDSDTIFKGRIKVKIFGWILGICNDKKIKELEIKEVEKSIKLQIDGNSRFKII